MAPHSVQKKERYPNLSSKEGFILFIIVIFIFGPPRYYVVPILSMIIGCGSVEFIGYKLRKKDEF